MTREKNRKNSARTQTHNEDVAASPSAHLFTRIIFILQTMCQTTKKQSCCTLNNVASEYREHRELGPEQILAFEAV